jgi:hypothetical protein
MDLGLGLGSGMVARASMSIRRECYVILSQVRAAEYGLAESLDLNRKE